MRSILSTLALLTSVVSCSDLAFHRVRLLDYQPNGNTWLFRSNLPILNGTDFAFDTLRGYMAERAAELNVSFPSADQPIKMVDFTLLNWLKEYSDIETEENFFKANPDKGQLVQWPIIGSLIDPNWLSAAERQKEALALNTSSDDLPLKIPQLNAWVNPSQPPQIPTVYFFHCEGGADRTGQVAGSYMMTYKNKTLQEVYDWDTEVAERPMATASQFGMQFYCWYLVYAKGYSIEQLGCDKLQTSGIMV